MAAQLALGRAVDDPRDDPHRRPRTAIARRGRPHRQRKRDSILMAESRAHVSTSS